MSEAETPEPDEGPTCQICGESKVEVPLVACKACETVHHKDCWAFQGGCATFGCGSEDFTYLRSAADAAKAAVLEVGADGQVRSAVSSGRLAIGLAVLVAMAIGVRLSDGPELPARPDGATLEDMTGAAWARWGQEAGRGNPDAQFQLGWAYESGEGIREAPDRAAYWYERAALVGHPESRNNLGRLYLDGRGVRADPPRGVELVRQAAEDGDPAAQANLGVLLYRGRHGLAPDLDGAARWFEKAAAKGNNQARYNLAVMMLKQPRPNRGRARQLLREAERELVQAAHLLDSIGRS